jgi:hypothetical protein
MADSTNNAKQQNEPRGIAAAAIEGAREGEVERQHANPDDPAASLARPAPGMTEQPEPPPSTTNQYTGITGGLHEEDGERDRDANPDATDETRER